MTFYFVEASFKSDTWRWMWSGAALIPESRSEDKVIAAASSAGFDVVYCDLYTSGVPKREGERIRKAVFDEISKKHQVKNYYDIKLNVTSRMTGNG